MIGIATNCGLNVILTTSYFRKRQPTTPVKLEAMPDDSVATRAHQHHRRRRVEHTHQHSDTHHHHNEHRTMKQHQHNEHTNTTHHHHHHQHNHNRNHVTHSDDEPGTHTPPTPLSKKKRKRHTAVALSPLRSRINILDQSFFAPFNAALSPRASAGKYAQRAALSPLSPSRGGYIVIIVVMWRKQTY